MSIGGMIALSAAQTGLNIGAEAIAARRQLRHNKSLAAFQHANNRQLLQQQLEYNTPKNQMARYKDAGLNPNMVVSQGSAGNQSAPLSYPDIKPSDMTFGSQIGTQILDNLMKYKQTQLIDTQKDLNKVKVDDQTIQKQIHELQASVLRANPNLNSEYVRANIDSLIAAAQLKSSNANHLMELGFYDTNLPKDQSDWMYQRRGNRKIELEIMALEKDLDLKNADKALKAKVFESKEFQNKLLEIQNKWMTDAEITPQHIYQFIMMLISRMM